MTIRQERYRALLGTLLCWALLLSACTALPANLPSSAKPVSFALLEDYDKGDDLDVIAQDFALVQELEIDTMRVSFGWDDYEPQAGVYDFAWLKEFVALADEYGIQLRPYIGYTPDWAGEEGGHNDGMVWNNPPRDLKAWSDFVYALASELADAPNVLSYEIYNEQNSDFWWDGRVADYAGVLLAASEAIRRADPDAEILVGGLTYPDENWLRLLLRQDPQGAIGESYDVMPFHAYVETWSEDSVEGYLDDWYRENFVALNETAGSQPIWINEMGFATTPGRSEREQANWFARATATFLADPTVEHLGYYELRDLSPQTQALGDDANYFLGLLYNDGTKKLAFATVDLLTDLLDTGTLVVADDQVAVDVAWGSAGDLHHHLFVRPDGVQVLFIYDKAGSPTVNITLDRPGSRAIAYALDGSSTPAPLDGGTVLGEIALTPGEVAIFAIEP
jgi:hypothetical protein